MTRLKSVRRKGLKLTTLSLALTLILFNQANAQWEKDIANLVDAETAAVLAIPNFAQAYQWFRSNTLFDNPRLTHAIQLLADERFPILSTDNRDEGLEKLYALDRLLRRVKEVNFVVHQYNDERFQWSLFVMMDEDRREQLYNAITDLNRFGTKSLQLRDQDESEEASNDKPKDNSKINDDRDSDDLGWCQIKNYGDWLLISNHSEFVDNVETWNSRPKFRALAKSRKYLAIKKQSSRLSKNQARISIYGNPVKLFKFVPNGTPERWEMYKVNELPSCGINLILNTPDSEDQSTPAVVVEAIVKFTQPTVGYARMFQQYQPVRIPPLAVEPIELQAFARNEKGYTQASIDLFDEMNGKGAAESAVLRRIADTELDYHQDVLPRRSGVTTVRYLGDNGEKQVMVIEPVEDVDAASRFAKGLMRAAWQWKRGKFDLLEQDGTMWWTRKDRDNNQHSGVNNIRRSRELKADWVNTEHDAYALTENWWCQGDLPKLEEQVELLITDGVSTHTRHLQNLVDSLCRQTRTTEAPVIINYFTADSWQDSIDKREEKYAADNATPHRFVLNLEKLKNGGTIDFSDFQEAKNGNSNSGIKVLEDGDEDPVGIGRQELRVMMPLPLAQRNSDGHRIVLRDRQALAMAFEVMILKCVSEAFPRTLMIYTHGEGRIRVVGGLYSN